MPALWLLVRMKFINLTNRPVTVQTANGTVTYKSDGYCGFHVHRFTSSVVQGVCVDQERLEVAGVPDAQPGVMIIVPRDVRLALYRRFDLVTPDGLDDSGVYWRFVANG